MAQTTQDGAETRVADTYGRLKARVVGFGIRPGERLNEVALAREIGVSRTPLREALNQLVAERLIDFRPGTGFVCRPLEPKTIFDLYELRQVIEVTAVRLAIMRASDEDLRAVRADLFRDG
jgi:DNA-binding GntR family transcriptional regulator